MSVACPGYCHWYRWRHSVNRKPFLVLLRWFLVLGVPSFPIWIIFTWVNWLIIWFRSTLVDWLIVWVIFTWVNRFTILRIRFEPIFGWVWIAIPVCVIQIWMKIVPILIIIT